MMDITLFSKLMRKVLVAVLMLSTTSLYAQLQLSAIYKSGMMLQHGTPIPVWGTASIGDSVSVTINSVRYATKTNISGNWEVTIPAMASGGPVQMLITTSSLESVTLSNIYVGDVWLASGQSNMEYEVSRAVPLDTSTYDALIREFKVPKGLSAELSNELPVGATWNGATIGKIGNFSAVAYYFAKDIRQSQNIPVGIINTSYGGARIEAFMSKDMLGYDENFTVLQPASYYAERQPTMIYNKMINPILRFPIKGILWYQGESNADAPEDGKAYAEQFNKLINAWRANFGLGNIPFIYIQLPNTGTQYGEANPQTWDVWPQMRAGQEKALRLPNTGMAVTIDVGAVDIHPPNKMPVGKRAALVARNVAYGENILSNGPVYKTHTILTGGKVQITFDYVGTGLISTGSPEVIKWFSIAGSDGVLKQAKAKIINTTTVEVWHDAIANPEIIRYAWEYNPNDVNLYNSANLPAVPFYLYVTPKTYAAPTFTSNKTTLLRGNSVFLEWKAFGTSSVTLNGLPVDSIAATMAYPRTTTTYKLKTVNASNPSQRDSVSITVVVQNPPPTIAISSSLGTTIAANTSTLLTADAKSPGDGVIERVVLYINGDSITQDLTAPFEMNFTTATLGNYVITAKAVDTSGLSTISSVYNLLVANLKLMKYEAELSTYQGEASVVNQAAASNGKVLYVQQNWKFAFTEVVSPDDRTYLMKIRYSHIPGTTERRQFMYVNNVEQEVIFLKPVPDSLYQYVTVNVTLKPGVNEIRFESSWGWMSFDYISMLIDADATIPPSIKLAASTGNTIAPNTPVTLTATPISPSHAVAKVEFLVDNQVVSTDTDAPYQMIWTPATNATYSITARITDTESNTEVSVALSILVTNLTIVTLEAEDAVLTGTAAVATNGDASGGEYADVHDVWVVKYNNVTVPTAGIYELTIGYRLIYEGPKTQKMFVNGISQDVVFTAPDADTWMTTKVNVTLNAGTNEIRFEPSWGWMAFDYIKYGYEMTLGVNTKQDQASGLVLHKSYPNPASSILKVSFDLDKAGDVELEIIKSNGQRADLKKLGNLFPGSHTYEWNTQNIGTGIYLLKLSQNENVVTEKIVVQK